MSGGITIVVPAIENQTERDHFVDAIETMARIHVAKTDEFDQSLVVTIPDDNGGAFIFAQARDFDPEDFSDRLDKVIAHYETLLPVVWYIGEAHVCGHARLVLATDTIALGEAEREHGGK